MKYSPKEPCESYSKSKYLEGVDAGINVRNIDPLAIDVVVIGVGAVDGNALIAVVGALVDGLRVVSALVVL